MAITTRDDDYKQKVRYQVGQNIKRLMKQTSHTNSQVSDKTGISPSLLSHYMSGSRMPTIDNLLKIADVLKCDVADLIYKEGTRPMSIDSIQSINNLTKAGRRIQTLKAEIEKLKAENKKLKNQQPRRVNIGDYDHDDYEMYKYISQSLPYRDYLKYKADYDAHKK